MSKHLFFRAKFQGNQNTQFPWDETNKTEDEKLTAWMVSDNGKLKYSNNIQRMQTITLKIGKKIIQPNTLKTYLIKIEFNQKNRK